MPNFSSMIHECLNHHAMVSITDDQGVIVYVNHKFCSFYEYSERELLNQPHSIIKSGEHLPGFFQSMWKTIRSGNPWHGEMCNVKKSGEMAWSNTTIIPVQVEDKTYYTSVRTNITPLHHTESEILTLAFYDQLTGLANRRLLLERLYQSLLQTKRTEDFGAVMFIDLDDFKTVNDTLGHDSGDVLLVEVANRIKSCVRESDTVARFGGDEFVILLPKLSSCPTEAEYAANVAAQKVMASFAEPFLIKDHSIFNSPSIGITLFSKDTAELDDILKQADLAMYEAKGAGKNTVAFFKEQMYEVLQDRADLESALREAVSKNEFELYYQAQVDNDMNVVGAECLLRWDSPIRGKVPAGEIIPVAERTGLIIPIGYWAIKCALTQIANWSNDPVMSKIVLSVNVSIVQLRLPSFVQEVMRLIKLHKADPTKLKLEVTESVFVDNINDMITKMGVLTSQGVTFSLDDFGTSYSSLSYLKKLPLTSLKIDQSFVRDVNDDYHDAAIVRTIIALANNLELETVAEGVETEEQLRFLQDLNCDKFQGYLFAKPVPVDKFVEFCNNTRML